MKAVREKWHIICSRTTIRMTVDFSLKTIETKRKWYNILKVLEEKICQPRILCPLKTSLRNEGKIRTFSSEEKLRDFIASRHAVKELLKKLIQTEVIPEETWNIIYKERVS